MTKHNDGSNKRHRPAHGAPRGHGGMFVGLDKPKNFRATFRRLLTYLRPFRLRLTFVLLIAVLGTAFSVIGPIVMGKTITIIFEGAYDAVTNSAARGVDFELVAKMLLFLAGLYVFSSLFQFVQGYMIASISQRLVYNMREQIFTKLNRIPLAHFDKTPHGDTLSRVTNDVDTIASTLQQTVNSFFTSIITVIGIAIMMFVISPLLTIIALISIPLSVFVIRPLLKRSQKYFGNQQRTLGELNGHVEEMYTGHIEVTTFGREEASIAQFRNVNDELYEAGRRAQFISGIVMPVMNFIGNISYVLISIVAGILVIQRTIAIGDIQAFITYTKQFTQPISQTANIANIIQSTIAAAERVFQLLDVEEEKGVTATKEMLLRTDEVKGNIRFDDVSFGYDDTLLMRNLHIDVTSGQKVAIVGPTGAGKTTLVNLLMRFYDVKDGAIYIDDIDITTIPRAELRQTIGMVLQDTWLFKGTIKENIRFGKETATDEEVIAAAKAAYADDFITKLPDGYDTVLNEEASNISQGQKQLLTIARAMLANAPIMILDEATSSVDTRTELFIQRAMSELMKGRTSFIIAHRLSTIQDADLILVMDEGQIVEQGTHEALLQRDGLYKTLYTSQFAGKAPA
ncbi:MAG TPA: ABC transporter ATP-binding protein [Pseudogracilibacillus sp.]|nr:ABC transporter ATP-binding protein [Pseudogracilibacillus sp.]